jgi:hypothetical protein
MKTHRVHYKCDWCPDEVTLPGETGSPKFWFEIRILNKYFDICQICAAEHKINDGDYIKGKVTTKKTVLVETETRLDA